MLAAGVQARDAEPIMAPYDAAYAVDPAKLPSVCAAGSNAKLYLKFGDTVLATPRAAVTTFTPMRVAVVKDNDVPIGFSFPADSGCAENPIVVARADVRLEGQGRAPAAGHLDDDRRPLRRSEVGHLPARQGPVPQRRASSLSARANHA